MSLQSRERKYLLEASLPQHYLLGVLQLFWQLFSSEHVTFVAHTVPSPQLQFVGVSPTISRSIGTV